MRIQFVLAAIFVLTFNAVDLAENQASIVPLGDPLVHPAEIHGVAISADGKWVATGATDRMLRIWDVATGKLHGQPLAHDGAVYPVAFSPDNKTVAGGTQKGARLWDVETGKELAEFPHRGFVYSLCM